MMEARAGAQTVEAVMACVKTQPSVAKAARLGMEI